mmetsp:Transcript_8154/g.14767  ORF Transcript_8154/g.14767 Transcript_8154/m.14767 type:complete len:92 (+) Transcript_8154:503-778(+)
MNSRFEFNSNASMHQNAVNDDAVFHPKYFELLNESGLNLDFSDDYIVAALDEEWTTECQRLSHRVNYDVFLSQWLGVKCTLEGRKVLDDWV